MFKDVILENYDASVFQITMQASSICAYSEFKKKRLDLWSITGTLEGAQCLR